MTSQFVVTGTGHCQLAQFEGIIVELTSTSMQPTPRCRRTTHTTLVVTMVPAFIIRQREASGSGSVRHPSPRWCRQLRYTGSNRLLTCAIAGAAMATHHPLMPKTTGTRIAAVDALCHQCDAGRAGFDRALNRSRAQRAVTATPRVLVTGDLYVDLRFGSTAIRPRLSAGDENVVSSRSAAAIIHRRGSAANKSFRGRHSSGCNDVNAIPDHLRQCLANRWCGSRSGRLERAVKKQRRQRSGGLGGAAFSGGSIITIDGEPIDLVDTDDAIPEVISIVHEAG